MKLTRAPVMTFYIFYIIYYTRSVHGNLYSQHTIPFRFSPLLADFVTSVAYVSIVAPG